MPTFGIQYAVGVDGGSILLVLLTTLLPPLCVLASWNSITTNLKAFLTLILSIDVRSAAPVRAENGIE